MIEEEVQTLGNAILSEVTRSLSIPNIREAAAAAGIDAARIPANSEAQGGMGSRAEVTPALHRLFGELTHERKERARTHSVKVARLESRHAHQRRQNDKKTRPSSRPATDRWTRCSKTIYTTYKSGVLPKPRFECGEFILLSCLDGFAKIKSEIRRRSRRRACATTSGFSSTTRRKMAILWRLRVNTVVWRD